MPELAEVERARRLLEGVALKRRIVRVRCAEDPIVFVGLSPADVEARLLGRRVRQVLRHGKYFWSELDGEGSHPIFHLGMTGHLRTPQDRPLRLASSAKKLDAIWPPKFTKLHLWFEGDEFEGDRELVFTNARRLGRVRFVNDPAHEAPLSKLGFDPLIGMVSADEFVRRFRRRTGVVKSVLLDQSLVAGVGNWIADEILYQAAIDPRRRVADLSDEELRTLRARLQEVVETACRVNAESDRFPPEWLFHRRWGRKEGATTLRGAPIKHLTLGGRSTAWVPSVQG